MDIKKIKDKAQKLYNSGVEIDDLKPMVKSWIKEGFDAKEISEDEVKEFKLELEEKTEIKEIDIEVAVKKAVDKAVGEKKVDKNWVPFNQVSYVPRPTKYFPDSKLAEKWIGNIIDINLLKKINADEKTITTYSNLTTDSDGGSAVTAEVNGIMADIVEKFDPYYNRFRQVPMGKSNSATYAVRSGDMTGYFVGENAAGTDQKLNIDTSTLTAKKIIVPAPVSNDLLRFGTVYNVADEVALAGAGGLAKKRAWALFAADGTADSTDGSFTSIPRTIGAVSSNVSVKEITCSNGVWTDLTYNDLIDGLMLLDWTTIDINNLCWFGHKNMYSVIEKLTRKGELQYMIQAGQAPIFKVASYPFEFANYMPSSHTDGGFELMVGDGRQTASVGITSIESNNVSVHPDTYANVDVTLFNFIGYHSQSVFNPGTSSNVGGSVVFKFTDAS